MEVFEAQLTDRDKAYIKLLGQHMTGFHSLLADMAGTGGAQQYTRELALAHTRFEEAYYHAREHIFRSAGKRNGVN